MRRALKAALICILMVLPARAEKTKPFTVAVYVDHAPLAVSPEGFVDGSDKWLKDSVGDLGAALNGKTFRPSGGLPGSRAKYLVVADKSKADIVLTVVARGTSSASLGQRTAIGFYQGVVLAESVPLVGVTRWVSMVLSVGTYRKEFVAWQTNQSVFSAGAWSEDARLLGQQAVAWVMLNEQKIRELQQARR